MIERGLPLLQALDQLNDQHYEDAVGEFFAGIAVYLRGKDTDTLAAALLTFRTEDAGSENRVYSRLLNGFLSYLPDDPESLNPPLRRLLARAFANNILGKLLKQFGDPRRLEQAVQKVRGGETVDNPEAEGQRQAMADWSAASTNRPPCQRGATHSSRRQAMAPRRRTSRRPAGP